MPGKQKKISFKSVFQSVWLFPTVLTLLLIIFTSLGIHGSSIGIYDVLDGKKDNGHILGELRTTRSDEWLVNTPMVYAQVKSDFPVINKDIGDGQDMAVALDVPYKEWSVLFKPQNLSFFILPLEQAFAFKWWLLSFLLMLSVYLFFLTLGVRKLPSALLAVFFTFSPFIQWWYQSITLLTAAYAFLLPVIAINLIRSTTWKKRLFFSGLLYYVLVSFALLMYPAFQVPSALFSLAVFVAWYLSNYPWRHIFTNKLWLYFLSPLVLSLITISAFLIKHIDAIRTVAETIYPGSRYVSSGGEGLDQIALWPLSYLLKEKSYMATFNTNPSEASTFLFFGFVCLPFLIYLIFFKKNYKNKIPKLTRYLTVAAVGLIAFFLVRIFIPKTDLIFNVLALSSVPHERLKLVFGMISLLILALVVSAPELRNKKFIQLPQIVFSAAAVILVSLSILYSKKFFTLPTVGIKEMLLVGLVCSAAAVLIIHPRYTYKLIGLFIATVFAVFSSVHVNPLYKGSSVLDDGALVKEISSLEKENDSRWIVDDYFPMENVTAAAGAESLGGVYAYPQINTWEKYFPGKADIFNRYAHVNFTLGEEHLITTLELRQFDNYFVKTSSCSQFLKDAKVDYIISSKQEDNYRCFSRAKTSPKDSLFVIYKRDN